jgi:cytochrome c biogenesis factor
VEILRLCDLDGNQEPLEVFYKLSLMSRSMENPIALSKDSKLKMKLVNIVPDSGEFHFSVEDSASINDWIILKVLEFPYIQILWLGCILMTIGALMSMMYRRKFKK